MADTYIGQGFEQGGVAGGLHNIWNAPGLYFRQNVMQPLDMMMGEGPAPADFGKLNRPQKSIWEELLFYNPNRPLPPYEQRLLPTPEEPAAMTDFPPYAAGVPSQDSSFFIPGMQAAQLPAAPQGLDVSQLTPPEAPEAATEFEKLMQALGGARWQEGASVGTNLFNIGASLAGGMAQAEAQGKEVEAAFKKELRQFEIDKLGLTTSSEQQTFENMMRLAASKQQEMNLVSPRVSDGMLIWGAPAEGGQQVNVQKIAPTKAEQKMQTAMQLAGLQAPNVAEAVMSGQLPQSIAADATAVLMPKISLGLQQFNSEYGPVLFNMDDASKRRLQATYLNQFLMRDPEVGSLVQSMIPELQQQQALIRALK